MEFFRKYQRYFFIATSVLVILSFFFFGTYSTFTTQREVEDPVAFYRTDNQPVTLSQKRMLLQLIDGELFAKEFVETGIAFVVAQKFFEEIKEDLQERLERVRNYQPYAHPFSSLISARAVWEQFFPKIDQDIAHLRGIGSLPTLESFSQLAQTYLDQRHLSAQFLKRILLYQQQQANVSQDPSLWHRDFSLFGFHSLEDWFGNAFLDRLVEFLVNGAHSAKEKGIKVSFAEAKKELIERKIPFDRKVIERWQEVMLFRKLLDAAAASIPVDSLVDREFVEFSGKKALVELYRLPEEFCFKTVRDLAKFELYLRAVVKTASKGLALPAQFLSPEEVAKSTPELVKSRCTVEFAAVSKNELMQKISLKQMWDWELEEANWKQVKEAFPFLEQESLTTKEERFSLLEKLDVKKREAVDLFAQERIIAAHPEWIERELNSKILEKSSFDLREKGGTLPFAGIIDNSAFILQLSLHPDEIIYFSQDEEHYFKMLSSEISSEKAILSFKEAAQDGTLDLLLDQFIQKERKKKETEEEVVANFCEGVLKAIVDEMGEKPIDNSLLAAYRFIHHLKSAQAALPEDVSLVKTESLSPPLSSQWLLEKSSRKIGRAEGEILGGTDPFSLEEKGWSSVGLDKDNRLFFFRLIEIAKPEEKEIEERSRQTKEELQKEAKRRFCQELLLKVKDA